MYNVFEGIHVRLCKLEVRKAKAAIALIVEVQFLLPEE